MIQGRLSHHCLINWKVLWVAFGEINAASPENTTRRSVPSQQFSICVETLGEFQFQLKFESIARLFLCPRHAWWFQIALLSSIGKNIRVFTSEASPQFFYRSWDCPFCSTRSFATIFWTLGKRRWSHSCFSPRGASVGLLSFCFTPGDTTRCCLTISYRWLQRTS